MPKRLWDFKAGGGAGVTYVLGESFRGLPALLFFSRQAPASRHFVKPLPRGTSSSVKGEAGLEEIKVRKKEELTLYTRHL
jgi:hypothetical protein